MEFAILFLICLLILCIIIWFESDNVMNFFYADKKNPTASKGGGQDKKNPTA